MRSSTLVSVLFTAGVLATPMIDRRALVFKDFVVTVTKFTTIGVPEASAAAAVVAVQPKAAAVYVPHGHYHKHQSAQSLAQVAASTSSSTTSSTTSSSFTSSSSSPVYVAPSSTQPTSTSTPPPYAAPAAPETTSTPTKAQSANNNLPTTAVPNLDSASDIYKGLSLQHHNVHRQNHSVSDMAWNETLAGYAEEVAKTCKWGHSS